MATETQKITTIRLGGRDFPVVPQKHARLRHHLSMSDFQTLMSGDYGHHSYRLLCILIPSISQGVRALDSPSFTVEPMPEYEWEGFHSQEDWEAYQAGERDRYDENNDPSPTTDAIVEAFAKALEVSGAGRLGKLLTLLQATTTAAATLETKTPLSPAQPGTNGDSPSTTTGTPAPTSTGSEG